ncbi:MAG: MFS transporter [Kofleriaceae bacterium]
MIKNRTAIVALLTGLNFLNYLDRFIVAAVLPRIKSELGISNFEAGLLATVFLLGYFVTAPIFGILGDRMSRKVLVALGVVTWSAATIASGLAGSLGMLIVARAVVGIGEASYATLAPTIIDDITPPDKKGKTLAIFFLAVPLGSALGYLLGGYLQEAWGWREAFFVGGVPGLLLAVVCLFMQEPVRKHLGTAKAKVGGAVSTLFKIVQYRRAVLGYCAHTASIGAFAYWAPTFLSERFERALSPDSLLEATVRAEGLVRDWLAGGPVPLELTGANATLARQITEGHESILKSANFWFGLVTVIAGAAGTIIGGRMADRALRGLPVIPDDAPHDDTRNKLAANAQLRVCAIGVAIAAPLAAAAFFAPMPWLFFVVAGCAEVGLFMSTAPINAIMLRTSPPYLRASAMAVGIFAIHLFGDLWSPPLVGFMLDYLLPTLAMMALPVGFAIATAVWWPRVREARDVA